MSQVNVDSDPNIRYFLSLLIFLVYLIFKNKKDSGQWGWKGVDPDPQHYLQICLFELSFCFLLLLVLDDLAVLLGEDVHELLVLLLGALLSFRTCRVNLPRRRLFLNEKVIRLIFFFLSKNWKVLRLTWFIKKLKSFAIETWSLF